MDIAEFRKSLAAAEPPQHLSLPLRALWWEAKGDWKKAHETAQADEGERGAWVHAYLHRVEGDLSNAGHWYRRAHKPEARTPLPEEWQQIVEALL
jgi:hypothetical protein